jgi:hypothetical protein
MLRKLHKAIEVLHNVFCRELGCREREHLSTHTHTYSEACSLNTLTALTLGDHHAAAIEKKSDTRHLRISGCRRWYQAFFGADLCQQSLLSQ